MSARMSPRTIDAAGRRISRPILVVLAVFGLLSPLAALAHPPGITQRVSVSSAGSEADFISQSPAISADGRFVAFTSLATNLVPGDSNNVSDVFVHDRVTGRTERVSVNSRGEQGNADSGLIGFSATPGLSADGRFVAFKSDASNLVKGDRNATTDVFVHDRLTHTTERVSVDSQGRETNGFSDSPAISADGRFVAFLSSGQLVPEKTNFADDIYVRDRVAGTTERVSVSSLGAEANNTSGFPHISSDGRFVTFSSAASNLVSGPPSDSFQVYIHDRQSGATELVSRTADGSPGDFNSSGGPVSADGRFVVFETSASNLLPNQSSSGQVQLFDRQAQTMEQISLNSAGESATDLSTTPAMSADGRFVAFNSFAANLAAGDENGRMDVFVRDRQAATTVQASVNNAGEEGESESILPAISDDGQVVAFQSNSMNLVPDKTTFSTDIFVHDHRPTADLAVTTSDAPDPVRKGAPLTYTIVATNNGPASATSATVIDLLSADVRFVSATATVGSCTEANGVVSCELGNLASGATASMTIVVTPRRVGAITNTVRAGSLLPDPDLANNTDIEATTVTQ
jgi:uncharacterized repeat protein (TIGR01451 family)